MGSLWSLTALQHPSSPKHPKPAGMTFCCPSCQRSSFQEFARFHIQSFMLYISDLHLCYRHSYIYLENALLSYQIVTTYVADLGGGSPSVYVMDRGEGSPLVYVVDRDEHSLWVYVADRDGDSLLVYVSNQGGGSPSVHMLQMGGDPPRYMSQIVVGVYVANQGNILQK